MQRNSASSSKERFSTDSMKKVMASAGSTKKKSTRTKSEANRKSSTSKSEEKQRETFGANIMKYLGPITGQPIDTTKKSPRRKQKSVEHEDEMDSDNESSAAKRQKPSGSASVSAKFTKNFIEDAKYLQNLTQYDTSNASDLPSKLEDNLSDEEEENPNLSHIGRLIDGYMESEQVKRVREEHDFIINFDCPYYENVGTTHQVFCLKKLEDLQRENSDVQMDILNKLFLASPGSYFRTKMLRLLNRETKVEKHKVEFIHFMRIFCYVFQIHPDKIHLDLIKGGQQKPSSSAATSVTKLLDQMAEVFEKYRAKGREKKDKGDDKDEESNSKACLHDHEGKILQENIYTLLDIWICFDFTHWNDKELFVLLCALSTIYLDKSIIHQRHRVAAAIEMTLEQLVDSGRLDAIISDYGRNGILKSANEDMHRTMVLLKMFIQFELFTISHKMITAKAILKFIISSTEKMETNENENVNETEMEMEEPSSVACPTLAEVLQYLPRAVQYLKQGKAKRITDLYIVYNQLIDELTNDDMLKGQSNESLEQSQEYYRAASSFLQKRNINDKMIDIWATSIHRIRSHIQDRKNKEMKSLASTTGSSSFGHRYGKNFTLSSSEEEDEEL